jgi:hypothetical protein
MTNNKWKKVPDFYGLEIDQTGTRLRKKKSGSRGYRKISTRDNNTYLITASKHTSSSLGRKHWTLHELQMIANGSPRPADLYVDHINGDTKDNRFENLEWVTSAENNRRARARKTEKKVSVRMATESQKRTIMKYSPQHMRDNLTFADASEIIFKSRYGDNPITANQKTILSNYCPSDFDFSRIKAGEAYDMIKQFGLQIKQTRQNY